jgi:hypothetical protein
MLLQVCVMYMGITLISSHSDTILTKVQHCCTGLAASGFQPLSSAVAKTCAQLSLEDLFSSS